MQTGVEAGGEEKRRRFLTPNLLSPLARDLNWGFSLTVSSTGKPTKAIFKNPNRPDNFRRRQRPPKFSTIPSSHKPVPIMGKGKPRGLNAARKLQNHRREQRWADLSYKKRALGTAFKSSPFGGSSHAKGIVLEKVGVEAKQPNSAIRKCVRVQLIKNGKKVTAFVPNDGCLNFVDENDEVLLAGFGRKGKAKGDIPGVRFKVVKVSGVGLSALWKEKKEKPRS
ncbi:hypothetical protein G7Y89_g12284 [Cudoniella acicularis]|nr:hypothetical protein G7Y89_g12284 [Cudoniella acicularis]